MPLLKHAKKKLKQDKVRAIRNKKVKNAFKLSVKKAKEGTNEKTVSTAFKAIDKAVKKNIIHKNKAARMKSALSKLIGGKSKTANTVKAPAAIKSKPTEKKAAKAKTAAKPKTAAKKASSKTSKK